MESTVLVDTAQKMKAMQEEIFGPVGCAVPFADLDEVLQAANDSIYGLAAAVWTHDAETPTNGSKELIPRFWLSVSALEMWLKRTPPFSPLSGEALWLESRVLT